MMLCVFVDHILFYPQECTPKVYRITRLNSLREISLLKLLYQDKLHHKRSGSLSDKRLPETNYQLIIIVQTTQNIAI